MLSQAVSCVWVVTFLRGKQTLLRLEKASLPIRPRLILPCVALGTATFIMQASESVISVCFNASLLKYGGDLYVGSMTIMQSIMQLLTVPVQGFTQGVQPIISYNYGAGNYKRVRETVRHSMKVTVGLTVSYFLLVLFVPGLFARIFTTNSDLLALVTRVLPIYMGGMWLFGVQMSAQMFVVGGGEAKKSLFIALLRKVIILIPLALILPNYFDVMGIYYSEPIADILSATTSGILLYMTLRKLPG